MAKEKQRKAYLHHTDSSDFVIPYLEREFGGYDLVYTLDNTATDATADVAVMISSTGIYDVAEGINYDENTPVKSDSQLLQEENEFTALCAEKGVKATILRCANIIGTGMNGLPMRLARGIARGTLMNIKENDAVINTVHAVDVARVARALVEKGGIYNVTSGHDTPITELINALAYRVKNKEVFKISAKWARLIYGKEYFDVMTKTLTFNNMRMVHALPEDMQLNDVVTYLKNHEYTDDDI